jgi:hypothetical protein
MVAATNGALIYGCSSDDNAPPAPPSATPDTGPGKTETSITIDEGSSADVKDSGKDVKKDTAKDTATDTEIVDAGPDVVYDPQGAPCGPVNTIQKRPCGMCGDPSTNTGQLRVCYKSDGGAGDAAGDGGLPGYWGPWSACTNGPGAVCDPNQTYTDENCGNCGTRQRICQVDCKFVPGLTCNNEGECALNSTDWEQLDCTGSLGHIKTCDGACHWDIATACVASPPNPNFITVNNAALNTHFSKQFTFVTTKKAIKLDTSADSTGVTACPATLDAESTVFQMIEIKNTTASPLKLSIWTTTSDATGTKAETDTIMAVYAGANYRLDDTQRLACVDIYSDGCDTTIGGALTPIAGCSGFGAGLIKGETLPAGGTYAGVPIAANSSLTLYVAEWSDTSTGGNFVVHVKTQ